MLYASLIVVVGLTAAMEVSNEPVAFVLDYGNMTEISLKAEDVMVFSQDIPQVKTIKNPGVTYAKRSMAEMMAANVPQLPPESKPTLPNESRTKKRLDHTPPFTGTVTGDVTIIKSATNQRIILISNIQGDGIMQVLVKGGTAKSTDGKMAKAVTNAPQVLVRNTKPETEVVIKSATAKSVSAVPSTVRTSLESYYKSAVPSNLQVVGETVQVK
tara:strand:- start:110 stop:751 length:642 start_codon:yes stop_codon:yes gene_type:complete